MKRLGLVATIDDLQLELPALERRQHAAKVVPGQAGIRAMLTHPLGEEAARFYARFGSIPSPLREQQLLLLLKDARRWVR